MKNSPNYTTEHISMPTSHPECEREHCRLRIVGNNGENQCLMDSVKSRWSNPTAINYCTDPTCHKFVEVIHSAEWNSNSINVNLAVNKNQTKAATHRF